jgi:hypothetical protein
MAKQPATMTDKTLATNVDGHKIQKPRLLDADHDREITRRNDQAITSYTADAGFKEVEPAVETTVTKEVKERGSSK